MRSNYGYGQDLHVFLYTANPINYFLPDAHFSTPWFQGVSAENPEKDFWDKLAKQIIAFHNQQGDTIFVFVEERVVFPFQHLLAVDPTTCPEWKELKIGLAQGNMIYDNGRAQIYTPGTRRDE